MDPVDTFHFPDGSRFAVPADLDAYLARVKAERDAARVEATLAALKTAAAQGDNVMPATIEAVKAMATVGEITNVLRSVYGDYQEPLAF